MTIFLHQARRLLRNKKTLLVMIAVPTVLTAFVIMGMSAGGKLRVGVVDHDGTALTEQLVNQLGNQAIVDYVSEDKIENLLLTETYNYILQIDEGFSEKLISLEEVSVRGYGIEETNASRPLRLNVEGFINAAKNVARLAKGDHDAFYQGMEYYQSGRYYVEKEVIGKKNAETLTTGLGYLVLSIIFHSTFTTITLLKDKQDRTFYRVLAAPIQVRSYMLQSIIAFLFVSLVKIIAVLLLLQFAFGMDITSIFGNLIVVLLFFAVVAIAYGVAVSSISKTIRQASIIFSITITPMAMLGGVYWPREFMPDFLLRIGDFLPMTWAVNGVRKVVSGLSLSEIGLELAILSLFALVFFLLGTWRKADVSS